MQSRISQKVAVSVAAAMFISIMVIERPSGITVAAHWVTLDAAGRRDYLVRTNVKVHAERGNFWLTGDHPHKVIGALKRA